MATETPNDIDRAAIAEHARRTAEQAALRKVRKTLDEIEESEAARRRSLRKILLVCAVLAAIGAWVVWGLMFDDRGMPKQPPLKVPDKVQQKQ